MWVFIVTKFYFTESQSSTSNHLNTCKYYVCGIKLETKVMRLDKTRDGKISLFHLKKCAVSFFLTITCNVSRPTSLACALRCIISAYCINHSLDKHNF